MSTDSAAPESKLPAEYRGNRALSVYDRVADPIVAIETMGKWISESTMLGEVTKAQGCLIAWHCNVSRKDIMELLRRNHVIKGKLNMRADAMLAGFKERGGRYKVLQRDSDGSRIVFHYEGETYEVSLTWDDVKNEPFTIDSKKGGVALNYATPLKRMQMLWARLVSDSIRFIAPEVIAGFYTPEEIGNDVVDDGDNDVIDAEFTAAAPSTPPSEAKPSAAESASEEPPFDTSQPVSRSEETTAAEPSAPPQEPAEQTVDVNPQQTLTQRNRDELLKLLAAAKKQLEEAKVLDAEKWKATLAKRGVTTARDLTDEQLQGLLWRLWDGIEKRQLAADLDVWINTALNPGKN